MKILWISQRSHGSCRIHANYIDSIKTIPIAWTFCRFREKSCRWMKIMQILYTPLRFHWNHINSITNLVDSLKIIMIPLQYFGDSMQPCKLCGFYEHQMASIKTMSVPYTNHLGFIKIIWIQWKSCWFNWNHTDFIKHVTDPSTSHWFHVT